MGACCTFEVLAEAVQQSSSGNCVMEPDVREEDTLEQPYMQSMSVIVFILTFSSH